MALPAKGKNFNRQHPELLDGEVFWANYEPERTFLDGKTDLERCDYASKRVGTQAFNGNGVPLNDFLPIFISVEEAEAKGKSIDELFARFEEK